MLLRSSLVLTLPAIVMAGLMVNCSDTDGGAVDAGRDSGTPSNRADAEASVPRVEAGPSVADGGSDARDSGVADGGSDARDSGVADGGSDAGDTGADVAREAGPDAHTATDGDAASTPDARDGQTDVRSDATAADAVGDAATGDGHTVYAVDDMGQLLRFSSTDPAVVTTTALSGLLTGESIHGIDFRPRTNVLYALGSTGAVYTVALPAGVATRLPAADAGVETFPLVLDPAATSFGFDFNPPADRIRVHTNTGKNYRLHPENGQSVNVPGDSDLFMAGDGGANDAGLLGDAGSPVAIVASAYINSVTSSTATKLYGIDSRTDQLVTFAGAPGFAEVSSIGPLGVDVDTAAGFDIYGGVGGSVDGGAPTVNLPVAAYAALRVGTETGLFTINLTTGGATLVGTIAHGRPLRGLAVQP